DGLFDGVRLRVDLRDASAAARDPYGASTRGGAVRLVDAGRLLVERAGALVDDADGVVVDVGVQGGHAGAGSAGEREHADADRGGEHTGSRSDHQRPSVHRLLLPRRSDLRERALEAVGDELVDVLWPVEVLEPVDAEVANGDSRDLLVAKHRGRRLGEEHLT